MRVLTVRNVEEAWRRGLGMLKDFGERQDSRAGGVLVAPWPVTTVYGVPTERVLLSPERDANPFFHLFESLWMLSGSDDARWLDRFVSDFSTRFGEEGGRMHGAYGHRWRRANDLDQLDVIVRRLRRDPRDRRAVIAMWDVGFDLWDPAWNEDWEKGAQNPEPRDLPCNTHIYPRIVNGQLDLTVCCRSNDIVWGAYGANAVHFSVLQEYLAGRIGVEVGILYQISNNWHGYTDVLQRVAPAQDDAPNRDYAKGFMRPMPMGTDWSHWDADLALFMAWAEDVSGATPAYSNPWFLDVATPMYMANVLRKSGDAQDALSKMAEVQADDWRTAGVQWLERRKKK